ncbi:transcriptional regulator [Sphaerisporangium rufum]|uniref:Transcriptional regulator n=1 Tax=Sphaerisporangium rufum TaxID=1381558 RepID=A0A919V2Y5_9ACTN|nr:helix-turn-helix domain-containing protein [Sphaerisporangium rufum]GII79483.1 transcriptional regulator [Sphaerisporangium rufum]
METTHKEDAEIDRRIGSRVRTLRLRRGLGLRACAELCGRTEEWLRQVERGQQRLDKLSTLVTLAEVLGVRDIGLIVEDRLHGSTCTVTRTGGIQHKAVPEIRRAMSTPLCQPYEVDNVALEIDKVQSRLASAWSTWHGSTRPYTALGVVAPGLVRDALSLHKTARPSERIRTWSLLADVFQLTQRFMYCVGETEIAARAADRAMVSAEETGDPISIAIAAWTSTMAALGRDEIDEALDIAINAVRHLAPHRERSAAALSAWGSLQLFIAIASAKNGRVADAWRHWDLACGAAARLGPLHHDPLTMFGEPNVGIYAVAIDVETGRSAAAIDRANAVDVSAIPSSNRRAQHLLDVARGYLRRHDDDAAMAALRHSEVHSAETVVFSPIARQMIREMLSERRRPAPSLLDLAVRTRIIG